MVQLPPSVPGPPSLSRRHYRGHTHSVALRWTSDRPDAETLPHNTQKSQKADVHAAGGIRTRNPSTARQALDRTVTGTGSFLIAM